MGSLADEYDADASTSEEYFKDGFLNNDRMNFIYGQEDLDPGLRLQRDAYLLRNAFDLVISADTGPLHIAHPHTLVIGLFGPTSRMYEPFGRTKRILRANDLDCTPKGD